MDSDSELEIRAELGFDTFTYVQMSKVMNPSPHSSCELNSNSIWKIIFYSLKKEN